MKTRQRTLAATAAAVACTSVFSGAAFAAELGYTIRSQPVGVIAGITGIGEEGTVVASPNPPRANGDLRFAYWSVDGVPAVSAAGPALTVAQATLVNDGLSMVAVYLSAAADTDADGIADWEEWRDFGELGRGPGSDPEADGIDASFERARGYPPTLKDTLLEGGLARVSSARAAYHDPVRKLAYQYASVPSGLFAASGVADRNDWVTTPNLEGAYQGYRLGYWTVDGVRVASADGGSPAQVRFRVTHDGLPVVAHFFLEGRDADSDGIADWQEYRRYGSLANGPDSDADGDGMEHATETTRGYPENIRDRLMEGGMARCASAHWGFRRPGAVNAYTIGTEPAGFYSGSGQADAGTMIALPALPETNQGYVLSAWLLDGKTIRGPDGGAKLSGATFVLTHDGMAAVAKYVLPGTDADMDLIPDYLEWQKFGWLGFSSSSDADGDGWDHALEMQRGYPMNIRDRVQVGGIARAASAPAAYRDPARKLRYTLTSEPGGLMAAQGYVDPGWVFVTPIGADSQGFRFGWWEVDGVRQEGPDGASPLRIVVPVDHDGKAVVAHYYRIDDDSDGDGIADWFEQRYFGGLYHSRNTGAEGDDFPNGSELDRGYAVTVADRMGEGGLCRTASARVVYRNPERLVVYEMKSFPEGLVYHSAMVEKGTELTTPNLVDAWQGYAFSYWTVDGVRREAPDGSSLTQIRVVLARDGMEIVAHFRPVGEDTDGDGMLDWQEERWFGGLGNGPADDPDGDGIALAVERERGWAGTVGDRMMEGGLVRVASVLAKYHDPDRYKLYLFGSDPAGLIVQSNLVLPGTVVSTPNRFGDEQGYAFAYWSVNGERQAGPNGVALTRFSLTVVQDTQVIGHFLLAETDVDGDEIEDWWEWFYFGSLAHNALSDPDGDEFDVVWERLRGWNAAVRDGTWEGGLARSASRMVRFHDPTVVVPYTIRSEPEGLVATETALVTPGSAVMTPIGSGTRQGYQFGYWAVNGVIQTGPTGRALERVRVVVRAPTEIVAHHWREGADEDEDGIEDAVEATEFGGLEEGPGADVDADGTPVGAEIARGWAPRVRDRLLEGGLARAGTGLVPLQMAGNNLWHALAVTALPPGAGSAAGAGIYKQGEVAKVVATPATGFLFAGWTGAISGTANPGFVTMSGPKEVVATFVVHTVPVAEDDWAYLFPGTDMEIPVLDNDRGMSGATLSIVGCTQPTHGGVATVEGDRVRFAAAWDFAGAEFTYTIADGLGATATGTIRVGAHQVADVVGVGPEGATLRATIWPCGGAGKWWFEYGVDEHYGFTTPAEDLPTGAGPAELQAVVAGLNPDTEYRFRLVLEGECGRMASPGRVFVTGKGDITHHVVARSGWAVPGMVGTVFGAMGLPAMNADGTMAFRAEMVTGQEKGEVMVSGTSVVARTGEAVPGADGTVFVRFRDPVIGPRGKVAFLGRVGGAGVASDRDYGLWSDALSSGLELLAREGGEVPGTGGAVWRKFKSVALEEQPDFPAAVVAHAQLSGRGVARKNDEGLWVFNGGEARPLLREGGTVVVDGAGKRLKKFWALGKRKVVPGQGGAVCKGRLVALLTFDDGERAVVSVRVDGSGANTIVAKGDAVPRTAGAFAAFGQPGQDPDGDPYFVGILAGGTVPQGVFSASSGLAMVLAAGETVGGSAAFAGFSAAVGGAGGMAVAATLKGSGVTSANDAGLWVRNESWRALARESDTAPGVGGARWKAFGSLAMPGNGRPMFVAKLAAKSGKPKVVKATDRALWAVGSAGDLMLVVREGVTVIGGGTVSAFDTLVAAPGSPGQTRWHNPKGEVAMRVRYSDASEAVVKTRIP